MNERIQQIRKSLKLSRAAFGEKLGVSGDVINNLERGRVPVKEPMVKLICSCCNVSEDWLRTGDGEMFISALPPDLGTLAAQYPNMTHETYVLVEKLVNLPKTSQDIITGFLREVVEGFGDVVPGTPAKPPQEMSREELHAELDRQLSEEEKAEGNQLVSGRGNSGKVAG